MLFNFEERYKDYTNAALLQITLQPGKYQPDAVAAAEKLLLQRSLSDEDREEAADLVAGKTKTAQRKPGQEEESLTELLERGTTAGSGVKAEKQLRLFLIGLALLYLWTLYPVVRSAVEIVQYGFASWSWIDLKYLDLVWFPFIYYLLYQRKKWGWILLFSNSLFNLVSQVFNLFSLIVYVNTGHSNGLLFYCINTLIQTGMCLFLWREDIASLFGVQERLKKKALLAVTIGSVLALSLIIVLVRY